MIVQEPVQAAIWHCLNHYDYNDAIFLAERLQAEVESDESLFLLGTCYFRSGRVNEAYDLLRGKSLKTPQNRFLMAKCCTNLNKLIEAESILNGDTLDPRKDYTLDELISDFSDASCFALQLLSSIYGSTERVSKANEADKKALKLNPFLWKSFENLCSRGENPDPLKIFSVTHLDNFNQCHGTSNSLLNCVFNQRTEAPIYTSSPSSTPVTPNIQVSTPQVSTPALPLLSVTPYIDTPSIIRTPNQNYSLNYSSRLMSGIGNLNYSTDYESTPFLRIAPPLKLRRPPPPSHENRSPTFGNLLGGNESFKSNKMESPSPSFVVLQLNFSSNSYTGSSLPHPESSNSELFNSSAVRESALTSLGNDQKFTKRSLITSASKENPLKINHFGGTSSNISASQIVRRSSRLFGSTQSSVKENSSKNPSSKNRGSVKSPSRKNKGSRTTTKTDLLDKNERNKEIGVGVSALGGGVSSNFPNAEKGFSVPSSSSLHSSLRGQALVIQKTSLEGLMSLLRTLGTAYYECSSYNLTKSLEILSELPARHRNTGWVLGLRGKNYFEMGNYVEAKRIFQELRNREPYRLEHMELYSTALWHLQDDVELSYLASTLTRINKSAPQTWCATGNCFSHQKEHENAIKFFSRAVQVAPSFPYAYTLLGHEYIMIEETEKALSCFRSAVRLDPRHYNAWYGIGLTYYKQEAYSLTEIYYRKALEINKQSPILLCHIAVVEHALQKTEKSLETLNIALKTAPKNPLCKFEKASILFASEKYSEALKELNELKEIIPKESPVYFLSGKVHNKLNNSHMALMHFSWAMDLDPKGGNSQIKDALDPVLNRVALEDEGGRELNNIYQPQLIDRQQFNDNSPTGNGNNHHL